MHDKYTTVQVKSLKYIICNLWLTCGLRQIVSVFVYMMKPLIRSQGHTQSWGKGNPDLLTPCLAMESPTGMTYRALHLCLLLQCTLHSTFGPINPINSKTWPFLTVGLYKELNEVFSDQYVHLGGDEVSFNCW